MPTVNSVFAVTAFERIAPIATNQDVVVVSAMDGVISIVAGEAVVAAASIHEELIIIIDCCRLSIPQ